VLCAFEVADAQLADLRDFLDRLGYPSVPEHDNAAYRLFLSAR
jgi:hypothetical protein